jgi:hypothetical protein
MIALRRWSLLGLLAVAGCGIGEVAEGEELAGRYEARDGAETLCLSPDGDFTYRGIADLPEHGIWHPTTPYSGSPMVVLMGDGSSLSGAMPLGSRRSLFGQVRLRPIDWSGSVYRRTGPPESCSTHREG